MIFLHASDIHFGKRHHSPAAEAFLHAARELPSDAIVLSGDFTQRAKVREYEAARAYLDQLPQRPLVVTPGNHDVPVYRVLERAFAPYRNYRRYISTELNSVTRFPGATVVSLNSSTVYTAIVNGRLTAGQLAFAERAFTAAEPEDVKVLVIHHPLAAAPDYGSDQVLPGSEWIARRVTRMGVELVLSGHLHRAYALTTADVCEQTHEDGVTWLIHSGTTTSTRGRARERGQCSFNRIELTEEHLIIERFMYFAGRSVFEPVGRRIVPRGLRYLGGGNHDAP